MRSRLSCLIVGFFFSALAQGLIASSSESAEPESTRSWPKDTTPYAREEVPEDYGYVIDGTRELALPVFIVDVVVNNTNPNLKNTDTFNDGETSIAINAANPDEIVITAFSGSWGINAPLWHSTDGGITWTKQLTVPAPPGIPAAGCPCDQTIDYGQGNELSGTFLVGNPSPNVDVFSGTTTDPASSAAWNWFTAGGVTQRTNNNVPTSFGDSDQPWLLVNRDPMTSSQNNVYVAYDDFSGGVGGGPPDMRVAVSYGVNPPNFTVDNQSGTSTGFVNPGHRLAVDPRTGSVYSVFQRRIAPGAGGSQNINYILNQSTDGGLTWGGGGIGIVVANGDSTQPTPKFGTVNALLGGVLHAAVDPRTSDVYYVYGNRDAATANNRLALRRIVTSGGLIVGPQVFVTEQVQAAIPSVAVRETGTVGIFYYTFDGFSSDNFPIFTAHLAQSDDGATFTDLELVTFLSSARDNGDPRQRVLGDYMQMKALGNCFYGAFTANGVPFGRPFANHDPIFFKSCSVNKIVNDSVTFEPLTSTFNTTSDTTGCPSGFGGKFSFDARLTDQSSSPPLSDLVARVTTLTNGNLLENADGGPGAVGARLTIPKKDDFSDGVLSPGEFVDVPFSICLKDENPFSFFVDVLGLQTDTPTNSVSK
jgi:hypothetical protein